MNKKIFPNFLSIATLMVVLLLISCSKEEATTISFDATPLTVVASIQGAEKSTMRATRLTDDDRWSYSGFTVNDVLGIYSQHGDYDVKSGEGPLINMSVTCVESKNNAGNFKQEDGKRISPSHMSANTIFMYFPYEKDMTDDENIEAMGLELRTKIEGKDTLRCCDFLTSYSVNAEGLDNGVLTGALQHAFSELIIMRGEGFDNPPESLGEKRWNMTAVMNEGFSHVKINVDKDNWNCRPQLVYNDQDEYRRWGTWQGGNYSITVEDLVGEPAWYVILPTLDNYHTTINYIELYDNDGVLQQVSAIKLGGKKDKVLIPGWRYPIKITMNELGVTAIPILPILPWNGDTDITYERENGIQSIADFRTWREKYITYIKGEDTNLKNDLLQYGDLIKSGNQEIFHFYIPADLDFSELTQEEGTPIIPELKDILDGVDTTVVNYEFQNHKLSNLKTTFVGILSGNGTLQNIDFDEPIINLESSNKQEAVGVIVNSIEGGTINHCAITNGMLISKGPVGIVAGSMEGGIVQDCTLSGVIIGSESNATYNYMIGTSPTGGAILQNNDTNNIIFDKHQ